jgi:methionine-rich copper-binding protein CopC
MLQPSRNVKLRRFRFISTVIAVAVVGSIGLTTASAHAPLTGRTPAADSIVTKMPGSINVSVMDDGIGNNPADYVHLLDKKGVNLAGTMTTMAMGDGTMLMSKPQTTAKGWYAVNWGVTFSDGHWSQDSLPPWWAFGVGVTTPKSSSAKVALTSPTSKRSTATISGKKIGQRTLTLSVAGTTLGSVTWTLVSASGGTAQNLVGAVFTWAMNTSTASPKTAKAIGILPFAGVYQASLTLQSLKTNTSLQYTGSVSIGS